MIEASKRLMCVFVECAWGKKNKELSTRYGITGYPTVVLCEPDGKPIGALAHFDAEGVARAINEVADRFAGKDAGAPPLLELKARGAAEAMVLARQNRMKTVLLFRDDSPASQSVLEALYDPSMKQYHARMTFGMEIYTKGEGWTKKFGVTRAPTILVIDPSLAKPEEKPLARIEGSRTARELIREFDPLLTVEPGVLPKAPPGPGPLPKAPEEKLSDDQIERLFIQARVSVAQDLMSKGKKDKAVEIYEDLVKTYPKHVDIVAVKKLLDDAKK